MVASWFFVVTILLSILLPMLLAAALRRKVRVPWLYFCVGALTFIGAQLLHIPLNELLIAASLLPDGLGESSQLLLSALLLGLTAGLSEELARAAGFAIVRRARRYEDAVMMGLGHGGVEVMIIGGILVAASVSSLLLLQDAESLPLGVTAERFEILRRQLEIVTDSPGLAFLPLIERLIALALQISLSVLVMQAFIRRSWLFLLLAILYHAAVDAVAVYLAARLDNPWLIEALLALTVMPIAVWAWQARPRPSPSTEQRGAPLRIELSLFGAAVGKEAFFQWRAKRVLIVSAVFLVFGMLSPLIAKFTPELLGSLEGAEQFADLVPDPTVADAMGQYMRNLTQFGFILAILLGMGAIAGEKERGTAAMILSKPLPRWVFVNSKFLTQAAVFTMGLVLAAVSAYYYTLFLFESVDLGSFLLANLLLLLWLLVFVAVTILGSSVGRTTGEAAGIAGLAAVMLLLAGTIPRYGALAPGGLLAWAEQLAVGDAVTPNGGALATSLVLIVLSLIAAVAALEQQDV